MLALQIMYWKVVKLSRTDLSFQTNLSRRVPLSVNAVKALDSIEWCYIVCGEFKKKLGMERFSVTGLNGCILYFFKGLCSGQWCAVRSVSALPWNKTGLPSNVSPLCIYDRAIGSFAKTEFQKCMFCRGMHEEKVAVHADDIFIFYLWYV